MADTIEITYRALDDLIPYARNARVHDDSQILKLSSAIKEFGFKVPVLIDSENGVVSGHGRILAARKLGMTQIPCIVCDGWTDSQKRAFILADNRIAQDSFWDEDMLKVELEELRDKLDLAITGFDADELEKFSYPEIDDTFFGDDIEGDSNPDEFEVSLVFPKKDEKMIKDFVRKVTRQGIVKRITEWATSQSGQ